MPEINSDAKSRTAQSTAKKKVKQANKKKLPDAQKPPKPSFVKQTEVSKSTTRRGESKSKQKMFQPQKTEAPKTKVALIPLQLTKSVEVF